MLRPSKRQTPDEWAAENRIYPKTAAIPGPRDPHLTPYVIPIERTIASSEYGRVVVVMGAQSGKSELMLDVAGHRLDQKPAPILYVGPNKQFLQEQFEPRVMNLLDEAKTLRDKVARGKRMTKTRKTIAGVPFRLAHAGSSTALKSDPAALALVDEFDEMRANVNDQGGVLGLVERRGDTYAEFCCVVTSTPKNGKLEIEEDPESGLHFWRVAEPDDIDSPTWALWQQGTRHHWCWPCPHCRGYFVPRFDLVRFPEGATPLEAARATYLECPRCGGVIEERHKEQMNAEGRFAAPGQSINRLGDIVGQPADVPTASFWVSGLASPFVTFGKRVQDYLEAVLLGDPAQIQVAINGGFGELYEQGITSQSEWSTLHEKGQRSEYERNTMPDTPFFYLVLTVDVQKNGLPYVIRAWGPRATSWLVDQGMLRGDTADIDVWHALADLLVTPIAGKPVDLCFIDSGFRPGEKDRLPLNRVYEFCARFPRRVRATKGSSHSMQVPLVVKKLEVNHKGGAAKGSIEYARLDTDHWKCWVHERMAWPDDQVGAWHLYKNVDEDYCHQIVSEARVKKPTGGYEWVRRSKANHFFDCEAMQAAAGYLLNAQRIPIPGDADRRAVMMQRIARARQPQKVEEPAGADSARLIQPPSSPKRIIARRRVSRSNFMRAYG